MKDEDTFSNYGQPLSADAHEGGSESDGHVLASPPTVPQDASSPAHPPIIERQYAFLDHPTEKPDASCISSMPEPDFS